MRLAFILFLLRQHHRSIIFSLWFWNPIRSIILLGVCHTVLLIQDLIIWAIGFYFRICEMLKQICDAVKTFFK